jgi:chromosome segregation ATPase
MAYAKSKDKEARVEQLRRQVARRMIHKELARGWTAWAAKRAALAKKKQMLKQAAARLTRPALSASYRYWLKDFQEATKADDARRQRRELDALEVQLSESMYRVHELNMVRVAHEDEIEALKAKLRHSEEEVRTQESTVTDLRPRCMQQASQIVNLEAELESAKNAARDAERERDVAREQARTQHDANEALLARLLAEQRATFELELRELKEAHSTMLGERIEALESELRAESEQLLEVRQAQLETQERLRLESDGRSQVEAELGTTREKLDVTIGTLEERKADI